MQTEEKETKRLRLSKKRLCGIALAIIILSAALIYFSWHSQTNQTLQLKAVIADQAALTVGFDATFVATVMTLLNESGYKVDYYIGDQVTVDLYRNLPKQGYDIIILRVHTPNIFSGEPYDESKYVNEQLGGELAHAIYINFSYFAITPSFVKNSMKGKFRNSTVIHMGCGGLLDTSMAEAFVERGAKVYIGWRSTVLADHMDRATEFLLKHLVTERKTVEQAVTETMKDVGPYPVLAFYPSEAGMTVIADGQV